MWDIQFHRHRRSFAQVVAEPGDRSNRDAALAATAQHDG